MKKLITVSFLILSGYIFSQKNLTGTITAVKGKIISIKSESEEISFAKGDSCSVSKDISGNKNPFGINISSGWMGVGKAVVTGIAKNMITIKIVKETSNIVINGKKQEHFVSGKRVKLE